MKTLIRTLPLIVATIILFGLPRTASAAKVFASLTATPPSTNATLGVATSVSTVISLVDGNNGSSVGTGSNCIFSVSVSPADPSITTGLSVTTFSSVKNGTQNTTLTLNTTALTPANAYVVTIWANNNPSNSTSITPISAAYSVTVAAGAVFNPLIVWNPAGVDTNWSTAGNWTPSGPPVSSNDVRFLDLGAVGSAGTVDNYVDVSRTVGSIDYGQTNNFHTTLIAPGAVLSLVDSNGLVAGTGTDNGPSQSTVNTITGATGTLIVSNTGAFINIGQPNVGTGSANTVLDLSGLGLFRATLARLLVGVDLTIKGDNGSLNLARTNIISMVPGSTAPQIDIGDNSQTSGTTGILLDQLLLGQTNAFFVDSIQVGHGRVLQGGTMLFNSSAVAPTAYFRGTNGPASRVGSWVIADGDSGKTASCHGTNDFSLGTVDALVNNLSIGAGSSAASATASPATGTLLINAGTFNVNNLNLGLTTTNAGPGTGYVTLTGGTLIVNSNLVMASGQSASAATISATTATVTAFNGITVGPGTASLNLTSSTFNATNLAANVGSVSSPLANFNLTGSTLNLALQNGAPTIATANLNVGGGPNIINVAFVPLLTGFPTQFQVIQYGLNGGTSSGDLTTFVLGSLPGGASPAYAGYISNNVANGSIDVVITNGPFVPALVWDGTPSGNWNILTTANWRPKSGPDTVYTNTAFVTFDDSLTGTPNVNLTTTLLPGSLTISNNSVNYNFTGIGKISGVTSLEKQGTGTLILDNSSANDFSGGVSIDGGTLQVGNNDANGTLPAGSVNVNGTLVFDRSDSPTIAYPITGTGQLIQSNAGILSLSATNSGFTGQILAALGTLQTVSSNALGGTTNVVVASGGALDVDGQSLFGSGYVNPVVISGAGPTGNGALVNSGPSQTKVLHVLTLAADSSIGGAGDIEIRNSSGNSAPADGQLNGAFNLTKISTNNVSFKGVTVDPSLGNINVLGGSVTFSGTASAAISSLGNPSATVTVATNATFTLDTIGNVPGKNFTLTNGGTLKCSNTNTLSSPVTLTGAGLNAITVNSGSQFNITSLVSGPGGFVKNGGNTLYLSTTETYSGNTTISGGTLALYLNGGGSDGSIASSPVINVTAGATLDVSGRSDGTFTLTSGQTLLGGGSTNNTPGVILGNLTANAGSTVAPGGTNGPALLDVTGVAQFQGSLQMGVSGTNGVTQIDAASITYGGTLTVTNFAAGITNGETFQLFVATNGVYNAGSFSSVTLPTAPGLSWTNSLTVNGTITAGVVTGPPPVPVITHIGLTGNILRINGTNGPTGGATVYVRTSTNLALPLSQWAYLSTNTFFGGGTFNITNTVDPNLPQSYYLIQY